MRSRSRAVAAAACSSAAPLVPVLLGRSEAAAELAAGTCLLLVGAASVHDIVHRHLPDALLAAALVPLATTTGVQLLEGSSAALPALGIGAVSMSLPLLIAHLVAPRSLGFGDVKAGAVLGAAIGLGAGSTAAAIALTVALFGASAFGLALRRPDVALGPFLVLGASGTLLAAPLLTEAAP